MSKHNISRRTFIEAGALGAAGVCAAGASSAALLENAQAQNNKTPTVEKVSTLCDGCGNKCGMTVSVRDGKAWCATGAAGHPNSGGHLCGRGHGLIASVYSKDRLTKPLKKNGENFNEISWEQAFNEIGSALKTSGEKTAVLQSRSNCTPFTKRLVQSLGSAHYYDDSALHDACITAAIECVSGAYTTPDVKNAKYALMLDKSTYDGMRPAELSEFSERHADDSLKVVLVDPRKTAFGRCADEWLPIVPGTELALLIGIAQQLINNNLYNKEFVSTNTKGFDEFAAEMRKYDLAWASEKTGIGASKIASIAAELATNAPASFVDMPWAGTFGAGYKNSFDTCRMVYLINAMLGNINRKGGLICGKTPYVSDDALEAAGIKKLAKVDGKPEGSEASFASSSCVAAIDAMKNGKITTAVVVESNPLLDYPGGTKVKDALEKLNCLVVCDQFMTETAKQANYVLPLDSYLESAGTPVTVGAYTSVVACRRPAIERIHKNTRSIDEVVVGLAKGAGKSSDFDFSLSDFNKAWLCAADIKEGALETESFSAIAGSRVSEGKLPYLRTESGKIEFSSEVAKNAGANAVPTWEEPQNAASKEIPHLLIGEQVHHTSSFTTASSKLMAVSKMYNLDAAWVNSCIAQEKGINEGDNIKLTTSQGSITVRAHVTGLISPSAVWVPAHYGATSDGISQACGFGAAVKQLVGTTTDKTTGAAMMCETTVSIEKAGA